jgi:hypothetical protein
MGIFLIILSYFLVASFAFSAGFVFFEISRKNRSYSGVMKILREENKLVYSLELQEDPLMLEYKSEVVFKVETSDKSSNRE